MLIARYDKSAVTYWFTGIDVSGDPSVGNLLDYVVVLERARSRGLKVAVHLAEIPNVEEVGSFLNAFLPDRIGHGTCLTAARGETCRLEVGRLWVEV